MYLIHTDEIVKQSGNENVAVRELDLASFASVRKFSAGILETESRLDILINNAGCATPVVRKLTEDGLEYTMQSNYFGHFLLTNLLLGKKKQHRRTFQDEINSFFFVIFASRLVEKDGPFSSD